MFKTIMKILGVLALLLALLVLGIYLYVKPSPDKIIDLMVNNKKSTALTLFVDDVKIIGHNEHTIIPLASTVKIIVAVEYAEQAVAGDLNPDQLIALADLKKYYIAGSDGGAHPSWLKDVASTITRDSIPLRKVAQGMIKYSSNANTEYLLDLLGVEKVNNRITKLGITDHDEINYIVSALLLEKELYPDMETKEKVIKLRALSPEEYSMETERIHAKIKAEVGVERKLGMMDLKLQRVWSDRLPGSTSKEYAELMRKFNSKSYFKYDVQILLDEVMETAMSHPKSREKYEYVGYKGGSTAFLLTRALYASKKDGTKIEFSYFIDKLNPVQGLTLGDSLKEFEKLLITSEEFRQKVALALGQ